MSVTERETTRLPFDVDAALLVELGERLVARRSVAVAELIKNAYDADATKVTVSFENVTGGDGQIVVSDDGSGISLESMKRAWMRIATTDATVNARSKRFGRPRTGAKGVGRFACGRLASVLSLESVSCVSGMSERIRASFDWREFKAGLDLEDIRTDIIHESMDDVLPTGTTLYLHHLTDTWNDRDLSDLQAELDVLRHPNMHGGRVLRGPLYEPDPGFTMGIIVPEFPKYEGDIDERILGAAWGTLEGRITEHGNPEYTLDVRESNITRTFEPSTYTYRNLEGAEFTIHLMIYRGAGFRSLGFTLKDARKIGRRRGGVRVYLDGFQVFSYGAPGDDWLDLDQDRARRIVSLPDQLKGEADGLVRPMLLLPGNMQLFGAVAISRDRNPALAVSISRDRLVQNEGFEELRRFVRNGIDWMTVCYARELVKSPRIRPVPSPGPRLAIDALRSTRDLIRRTTDVTTDVKQAIEVSLGEVDTLLTQERAAHISELSMLRVLASAGTTVLVFDHTLRAMAGQLLDMVEKLGNEVSHLPADRRRTSEQILDDLRSWSSIATGQGSLVGLLVGSEARTRRISLAVRPLVETLSRGFSGYMNRFGIDLENAVPAVVRSPPIHEAELYAVLLNLLTNSFKAVREGTERRVRVEADMTRRRFTLRVHDTGIGVPPASREEVFEPFYTTSQPDPVLGIGTGLGLKIVRDIAYAWGGDARFMGPVDPWYTSIELTVPFRGRK